MERVFISYSHYNQSVADSLCDFLEADGIACWMSPRDISSGNYAGEITRALRASDIVIVICSKEANQSEHVKNEVTLAFNHHKMILPYCLAEDAFDDDLEYYLSTKQRIQASNNNQKDFATIARVIREYRKQEDQDITIHPTATPARKKSAHAIPIVILSVIVVILIGVFIFFSKSNAWLNESSAPGIEIPDSVYTEVAVVEQPAVVSPRNTSATKPAQDLDTFSGALSNGYPDGFGTLTFKKRRRIDMHDSEERFANPGDYIVGDWKLGHLNYGEWHKADGGETVFIQLGDFPDKEKDQELGKCVKP